MPFRAKPYTRSLFEKPKAEKRRPSPPPDHIVAHIDGGARGNPGPAGYGVVIHDAAGKKLKGLSAYLGRRTNNFAEYSGLIAALEFALAGEYKALRVVSDSLLLVNQMRGVFKVKNLDLRDFHARAQALSAKLDWFAVEHILRAKNHEADQLANAAMDAGLAGRSAAEGSPVEEPRPAKAGHATVVAKELSGVVRGGVVELAGANLPEGTKVAIRVVK